MLAMCLKAPNKPLELINTSAPKPSKNQVLVKVHVCGICRTDLHVVDGELTQTNYPIIPGHQIVGKIVSKGAAVSQLDIGERIGIPWLGYSCAHCAYCLRGLENLCPEARYTGCQINGGFSEYCVADADFCFPLPPSYSDLAVAPLLCAGLIGYRSLKMTGDAESIGFIGFGASAHILTQVAVHFKKSVYAFTRQGDQAAQQFASQLGAVWVGDSEDKPPQLLDSVIIFAADGTLIPKALEIVRPGGKVVCAGIHMSTIPAFSYDLLWGERSICSVANLTRQDGLEFLELADKISIKTKVTSYPLKDANLALEDLRQGNFTGAAVIEINL